MNKYQRVLVVSPGNVVTGGPECMHHLVQLLREIGQDAYIVYTPFDQTFDVPEAYKHYQTPIARFADIAGELIIFPEINTTMAMSVKNAQASVWWLSLDNFLERRHISPLRDKIRYFKKVLKGQRPMNGVASFGKLIHFAQSFYAKEYLESKGLSVIPFYEPIADQFLQDGLDPGIQERENEILYNPVKGKKITELLIKNFPEYTFTPLRGFDRAGLTKKFQTAKLYIDFGHFPGRERLPRESAMHGCCLITGRLGSAGNQVDLPIDLKYKLDIHDPKFVEQFDELSQDILNNFEHHYQVFASYRDHVKSQPIRYKNQLREFFIIP